MGSLVIFDFDGTLCDTHESMSHSIKRTFDKLSPTQGPSQSEVHKYISSGTGLSETFQALTSLLGIDFDTAREAEWIATYRQIYASEGQRLIKPYPGAEELLQHISQRNIPVGIVTNKGVAAVMTALKNSGLAKYIRPELVVGDSTPGATRKPDTSSYDNILVPALKEVLGVPALDTSKVLEVGDTVADILFARNIGAKSCWCRFGYGDIKACEELAPDFTVASLGEVIPIIDAL